MELCAVRVGWIINPREFRNVVVVLKLNIVAVFVAFVRVVRKIKDGRPQITNTVNILLCIFYAL